MTGGLLRPAGAAVSLRDPCERLFNMFAATDPGGLAASFTRYTLTHGAPLVCWCEPF